MQERYLDYNGLLYIWQKLKSYFVKREEGKGLSSNDLTNTLKGNYDAAYSHSTTDHAPSDAEKNSIVGVQKNGVDVSIDYLTRKVNIEIPTKTSDIVNDSGFITTSDIPEGSAASNSAPKMNGVATVGTELAFARGDHVHPSDINKVDKVSGKGLSTNDYTTLEKNKLTAIAEGAQVNVIETIMVNGTVQTVTSKSIDIAIPTNNNQLENGAGYATTVEVAAAIANAAHLKRTIVDGGSLPVSGDADINTIYMLPITDALGENKFTEWMVINGSWEKVGSSDVDLSDYIKTEDIVSITNDELDTIMAS